MKIRDFLKNEDGGLSLGLTLTRRGAGEAAPPVNPGDAALLESGDTILLENGDRLLLEA